MTHICSTELDPWWRHQMETFSALLALCAGNSPVPVNSPHKGQWRGVLMFSLICARINDWVNNREAGDLRRHCGHYDVSVMSSLVQITACCLFSASPLTEPILIVVNWTNRNKFQWNFKQNTKISLQESIFENVEWKNCEHFVRASVCCSYDISSSSRVHLE